MSNYDVVLKKVDPQLAAAVRDVIPTYSQVGQLFGEIFAYLGQHGVSPSGPALAIYYDPEYRERDADVEAAVPVGVHLPGGDRVKVRELPGVEAMACVVHRGGYDGLGQAYSALMSWIEANGYRIAGPNREVYLRGAGPNVDPGAYVTEVQFPVEKV